MNINTKSGGVMVFKRFFKSLIIIFFIIIFIALFLYVDYKKYINSPISKSQKQEIFRVEKGENRNEVIDKLYKSKIIKNKLFAHFYIRSKNLGKNLKQGVYILNTSMTPLEVFEKIFNGKMDKDPDVIFVTIPEGYTIKEIAEKLNKEGLVNDINSFIKECQNGKFDYDFLKSIPQSRQSRLEGYLFPDTYQFKKGISNHEIINKMLSRFNEIYKSVVLSEMKNNNYSLDEIITISSIVEEEAKLDSERPIIAKVFYNRLQKNMKLESCATVQYALGIHKSVLYYKDLEVDSPYNTYKYIGLPQGPICNPGKSSIMAALNPSDVNYIYFVSKGDGSHFFTNSYDEFLKYKKILKAN